ncbi:hypothetical protein ACFC08_17970 [Streptomyces sp. NPDC056112]|uniref:hypothetical protein n=1 Tax=Streptomyces sp. NPDC056112 TaxID=3345715 RepID=UPI0035D85EB3
MRIRHSRLTRDFLQVPNATVRDDRLSHMARGILVELLSRPDGWEATADDMWRASVAKHGKNSPGRRAFRAAFAELKEYGYLTASRELLEAGRYGTVLTLTNVSAVQADVPHGGTSVRPGITGVSAGGTDVPHGGTSEDATDVPHAGTSERPAETGESAGGTDVPQGGTPERPAETGIRAAHSDVPHAGTSLKEHGENTGKKTSSIAAVAPLREITAEQKLEFGRFWHNHPKSKDYDKTLEVWTEAVLSGVDPKKISDSALAYAHEVVGQDYQYVKRSANWIRDRRYEDKHAPQQEADPQPGRPQLRAVSGGWQPFQNPENHDVYDEPLI